MRYADLSWHRPYSARDGVEEAVGLGQGDGAVSGEIEGQVVWANVTHRLQHLLAELGLPRQRFHDLLHGCATLLLAQGVPLKTIQNVLGHSQISLTAVTYAHLASAMKRDAADQLEAVLTGTA
jgi:integrase